MATYSLLFGHAEWPEATASSRCGGVPSAADIEDLTLAVPSGLRARLEATAELEGVPWETWVVRALSRCVDPRLVAH